MIKNIISEIHSKLSHPLQTTQHSKHICQDADATQFVTQEHRANLVESQIKVTAVTP